MLCTALIRIVALSLSLLCLSLAFSLLVTPARIFRLWYAMRWWSLCARYKPLHTSSASLDRIPQIRRRLWMICWFPARRAMRVPLKWTGWMCPATSYSNHLWPWWVEPGGDPCHRFIFHPLCLQRDMLKSLSRTKPTVNEDDLTKLRKFTEDFGQEG